MGHGVRSYRPRRARRVIQIGGRIKRALGAGLALAVGFTIAPAVTAGASSPGTSKVYVTHGLPLDSAGTKVDVFAGPKGEPSAAGLNLSAVASFTAAGAPQIAVFVNDVSRTSWFEGRLSIRHAAAAPAVNVDLGLFPFNRFFPKFLTKTVGPASNGQQADLKLPALKYDIAVKVASNGAKVAGVEKFQLANRTLSNVYAVGNPANGTFQLIVQTIKL